MPPVATIILSAALFAAAGTFLGLGVARRWKAAAAAAAPAEPQGRGAFLYGEASDRRGTPRREAGGLAVCLSDAPDHVTPVPAKVIDFSEGGLRLEVGVPVMEGTAVWVRREGEGAWQGFRVCWCRKAARNWVVGCQADRAVAEARDSAVAATPQLPSESPSEPGA